MKKSLIILFSIFLTSSILGDTYKKQSIGDFSGSDLTGVRFENCNYGYGTSFASANLTGVCFNMEGESSYFIRSDFTDAIINGATFSRIKFHSSQLKSTASYKNKDLSGVKFGVKCSYMKNIDFSGFNLANVYFNFDKTLNGSNTLTDFTGVNFTNANLINANFSYTKITSADFTNAIITNANLYTTSFSKEQLYSTRSYRDHNLSGITFYDLEDCNLEDQNLQRATLKCSVVNTNFNNADLRGASYNDTNSGITSAPPTYIRQAILKNTIMSDGVIKNVSLNSREDRLTIRKYTPATEGGEDIIAKISEADVIIDNDASIDFELGAQLKITNGKSLTVEYGNLNIDTDLDSSTKMYVDDGAGFYVTDDTVVDVNIIDEIEEGESYLISILEWSDGAIIDELLAQTVENAHIFLWINGKQYTGEWDAQINGNSFGIAFTAIPEPSTYAMIFGAIALAFVAYRRRK